MNKYKLIRNNKHVEYKLNNKSNKKSYVKLKIAQGVIYVSFLVFAVTNPRATLQGIQNISYTINEILTDNNDVNNLDNRILQQFDEFENKIYENIPVEYLDNYKNNIKKLKYYENKNDVNKFFNSDGYYDYIANRIVNINYDNGNYSKHTLFHELIHLSSSKNFKSGFIVTTNNVGAGLTEGYTEYLTLKLFENDIETIFAYSKEIEIIEVLNQIIGEEKMMKYYFTNDLDSLRNDLSNIYGTFEDVDKLIDDIDKYTLNNDYSKLNDIGRSLIKYIYMSELKNNKALIINREYKYLLDGLHYNKDFKELENEVLEEISHELNIDKNDISFVEKSKNTQKK